MGTPLRDTTSFWAHGGYEYLDATGWRAIPAWGRDGWDLGSWPLVIILDAYRTDYGDAYISGEYGVQEYVEGDLRTRWYATRTEREAAIDALAEFHWRHTGTPDLSEYPEGDLPAMYRGRYSSWRPDAVRDTGSGF